MWKRFLAGFLLIMMAIGALAWVNREDLVRFLPTEMILRAVENSRGDVAPNRDIVWQEGPATASGIGDDRPPNIIVILFDDLGMNDLSTFGGGVAGGRVPTPNIDALAARGAIFEQGYAGNATCAPSRAMLMTGRYPTRTGFEFTPTPPGLGEVVATISNRMDRGALPPVEFDREAAKALPDYGNMGLPGSEVTIAELLQVRGYHTVHIGKWHLGRSEESRPNAQGFDESLLLDNMLYLPEDHPDVVNARLEFDPLDRFLWARAQYETSYNMGEPFEPGGYLTDYWTDESLKVIEANRNRPFFLYLAHWGVHTPLQASRADYDAVGNIEPHRLRVYSAMVRALDRSVGEIMAKLEEEGLADNTLILLSSDNGGAGYIGLPDVNAPFRGWKITLFEGGIRVPMFISWPDRIAPGTRIQTPVAHIDLMPTIAAAAGADLPDGVMIDGRNLLPLAESTGEIVRENEGLFWQSGYHRVVRAGDWKLIVDGRQKKNWLFDLANDPHEETDLSGSAPEKRMELQSLIDAHHKDAVPALYPYTIENPTLIDKSGAETAEPGDAFVWWPN